MKLQHLAYRFLLGLSWLALTACDTSEGIKKGDTIDTDDPILVDTPIAFVSRPLPIDEDGAPAVDDIFNPTAFNPGAQLILKSRATASAPEKIITEGVFPVNADGSEPLYDVKDLEVSHDGIRLLFAMRAPEIEDADDDEQPTWNIWEYHRINDTLRRVISSGTIAEQGQDFAPHYLADGRIVFSSTRQRRTRAILLDDRKSQYPGLDDKEDNEAFVLHVMSDEGTSIEQLSFNASHDIQPAVLASGELVYLRWDAINNKDALSLYKSNPDGTNAHLYYGYHTQNTGSNNSEGVITEMHELDDGRIMALLRPRETERLGGDIIAIDAANYIDNNNPVYSNMGASGNGQTSLTANEVDTEGVEPSTAGYFNSAYPLYDGTSRLLVSWSQCRLIDPIDDATVPCNELLISQGAEPALPLFGLWIYTPDTGTQLPVKLPEEGIMFSNAVVLAARTQPAAFMPTTQQNPEWVTEEVGVLHIRSVYDIDGEDATDDGIAAISDPTITPTDERPARFLRIVKAVPIPDDDVLDFDNAAYGVSDNQLMRDILGYVPVEPDGSVKFKIPADIPVMLDILDATGKRIGGRHENWLSLRPGEARECTGCHERNSEAPHGRPGAEAPSANPGAVGGIPFNNTQLFDEFGTPEAAPEAGETMAEYYARLKGPRTPSMDLQFVDEWTDPAQATPGAEINHRYIDLDTRLNANPLDSNCAPRETAPPPWTPPTKCLTTGSWKAKCRSIINYQDTIHPIWQADRRGCDSEGNLTINVTCTDCHTRGPAGALQLPAGQLELTGDVSQDRNDYITSYAELMFRDNEQELVGTSLADVIIEIDTGEVERDAEGNVILDEMGNPIPIIDQQTVQLPIPLSANGARASNRFFNRFEAGGSHAGWLTGAELKLIAEWLDIGAQYYNNPFDAPAD